MPESASGGEGVPGSGGVPGSRGVYLVPGGLPGSRGCLVPGGCLLWGVSTPGGGVCSQGGGGIPACTEAGTPPVNRMTDRCKNITLATTSLRPVISW